MSPKNLPNISIPTMGWFLVCALAGFLIANEGSSLPQRFLVPRTDVTQNCRLV
jgi:hypothetical protein